MPPSTSTPERPGGIRQLTRYFALSAAASPSRGSRQCARGSAVQDATGRRRTLTQRLAGLRAAAALLLAEADRVEAAYCVR
jgi:hypothetical protein